MRLTQSRAYEPQLRRSPHAAPFGAALVRLCAAGFLFARSSVSRLTEADAPGVIVQSDSRFSDCWSRYQHTQARASTSHNVNICAALLDGGSVPVPISVFGGIPFNEATSPNHWIRALLTNFPPHSEPGKYPSH